MFHKSLHYLLLRHSRASVIPAFVGITINRIPAVIYSGESRNHNDDCEACAGMKIVAALSQRLLFILHITILYPMNNTFSKSLCFSSILLAILLNGCTLMQNNRWNNTTVISHSAKEYLQKASESQGPEKQSYRLLAVNQLLTDNNLNDAQRLLNTINPFQLDPHSSSQKFILAARLDLKQNLPRNALQKLQHISKPDQLSPDIAVTYYTTLTEAYIRSNRLADSTIAQIHLNTLLDNPTLQQQNRFSIWNNLQTVPLKRLTQLLKNHHSDLAQGWLKLAIAITQKTNKTKELVSAIQSWQQSHPNHPANNILPNQGAINAANTAPIPDQIALLLPLRGKFGHLGQAVRDGFMTAFYDNVKRLPKTPNIKIYDTSQPVDVETLYQQAIQQGAQFVVGPLTKDNVNRMASYGKINVPTLALNYLTDQTAPKNMVQFGLMPEQATQQIANQIWQHGINDILIISPQDEWGSRIKKTFVSQWEQLGGRITDTCALSTPNNFAKEIIASLHIDQSKTRAQTLEHLFGEKIKFTDRRRQDIHGIFLAATPEQARQIQPLLKFYYAGNIRIFSISSIYSGYNVPNKDHDLNGIYFNDMPWLLKKDQYISSLKQQIQSLWPANYRLNSRLYGLGIDSYMLSIMLPRLMALPNIALSGVTGQLFLTSNQQIYRQLLLAKFSKGIPILTR